MEKRLCWASMGIAGVLLIAFVLDLVLGIPFGLKSVSPVVDIIAVICCALLGYLAWDAFQETR